MSVAAKDVKALRDATGAGMMDAKRALIQADGDFAQAVQLLREKGLAKAAARSDRDNAEGSIALAEAGNVAAVVQIKTETDFSAKSREVIDLATTMAEAVVAAGPSAVNSHTEALENLRVAIGENIVVGAVKRIEAGKGNLLDTYLHRQDGRGVNAVIVEGRGVSRQDLHRVALHIAFAKPQHLSADDVPAAEVNKERTSLLEITKAEGKPERAWNKIVEGRMRAWLAQRVLLEQGLNGEKTTVRQSIGNGEILRFIQVVIDSRL